MTSPEPQTRKKSALSEDDMWTAPAVPPAAPGPAPVPTPAPAPPVANPPTRPAAPAAAEQGQVRDLDEARGRNRVRSAIFAWAAAERKAVLRLQECGTEIDAALQRGTDPAVLHAFAAEACQRHGVELDMLPERFQAAIGVPAE
ncbi:hypothetical protein [Nocardia jinanensis]|uniref:Uncharacterized protein n=1 Tax=Nocardia jinanensis TaxID=382504 RepID=A0A917RXB4_9NOCA|nr:hypothetical protein [Nocardia jinanensis]GGL44170.1 hypothetical protein GCM10011588_68590 [Nocardia jinanensis]